METPAQDQLSQVLRLLRLLYKDTLSGLSGVLHCVSSVRVADEPARRHVININEHAPRSATDSFVLNLARASADAIVTTAEVLRAEPQLSHELQGPLAQGLARYRRAVLGKLEPPCVAILTRSAQLPPEHRVFRDQNLNLVLTAPEHAPLLAAKLARAQVLGVPALDIHSAVSLLEQRGARTILIEAGPSTAGRLYDPPSRVQHLLLSQFDGALDARALGGALPPEAALFSGLACVSEHSVQEPSGPWRFQHWQRSDRQHE